MVLRAEENVPVLCYWLPPCKRIGKIIEEISAHNKRSNKYETQNEVQSDTLIMNTLIRKTR